VVATINTIARKEDYLEITVKLKKKKIVKKQEGEITSDCK
jgi:hypothetical protein